MIVDTLVCLVLVLGATWGISRPLVRRLPLGPAEAVLAGMVLSLLAAWGIAWTVFISGSPLSWYWLIPAAGAVGLLADHRGVRALWADSAARALMLGQALVTAWCVACLAFVRYHSGGGWTGDSFEHWERTCFFLRAWPAERLFIGIYQVPARPPLGNVLTAAYLRMTAFDYAHFQLVMTVLCSLAFLPVAALALRFGGRRAAQMAAIIVMVNPLFIQNATYPWTKLEAAFFILSGLYFFLRVRDPDGSVRTAGVLCGLALGGALVTHYSAGPYVVVLAAAWIVLGFRRGWGDGFRGTTALAAAGGAIVLLSWFSWSLVTYGVHGTFFSNSTVTMIQRAQMGPVMTFLLNIRDTLIPAQVRGYSGLMFQQASPWGRLRDNFFMMYQLNPILALGCVGCVVAAREAWRASRPNPVGRRFWAAIVLGVFLLSFTTYGDRDHYGLGHLWLHSLVLLGLAFLASRWERLEPGWRRLLVLGWAVDFALGIALQFAVEDFALDRWLTPNLNLGQVIASYTGVAQQNLADKIVARQLYFADLLTAPPLLVLAFLAAVLALAIVRVRRPGLPTATAP